jgi:tRNA(Ile)-lysidine synthase
MNLLHDFQKNWEEKQFGRKQLPVLLACSGGRDSMALAHLLLQSNIEFGIAHCNFQLRSKESDDDEQFVAQFAKANHVPFFAVRFDTSQVMEETKKGIQETARTLRYEWLEATRKDKGFGLLITAHHANDNAETLLINLCKGTGIAGIHGIKEMNGNIIRPLLFATREYINEYVIANQVAYREDSSNNSEKYLRNEVRHHILPPIEKAFPNAIHQINDSILRFAQSELVFRKEMDRQIRKLVQQRGEDVYVPVLKLMKSEVKETLCYELFSKYGFSSSQMPSILILANAESGKYVENSSYKIIKDRSFLIITPKKEVGTLFHLVEQFPAKIITEEGVFTFALAHENNVVVDNDTVALIDMAQITQPLIIRRWRTGDYFYPLGMGMKKKKLSRFLIVRKITLHEKERIWVLESNKRMVWVAGQRLDERFKIKPTTTQMLKVTFLPA